MPKRKLQSFGGNWTEQKLAILRDYLQRYTTALKNTPFTKYYIDAFAGTGYREDRDATVYPGELFAELTAEEVVAFRDGSARLAVQTEPAFDRLLLMEKSKRRANELS